MHKNSTLVGKYIIMLAASALFSFSTQAQIPQTETTSPKLRFASPVLVSGTGGQLNATYKFSDVIPGVDAFVKIEKINNGAKLVNIDDSTLGYYNAWQPTVGGPGTYGSSSITWSIAFKTTSGSGYTFPIMDLTAVDIDGDNQRVREFIDMEGQSSWDVPTVVPTLLSISYINSPGSENENDNQNGSSTVLHVLGPVTNRTDIDTASLDVKMNYHFLNQSNLTVTIGSQVDNNGTTGGIATDRYSSLYFKSTSNAIKLLAVAYRAFDVTLNNNKVNLLWITGVETGSDYFEVERSFDQTNFSTIGMILGAQSNNSISNQYSFKDDSPELLKHTVIYYRLKDVNPDGKFTYSVVKTVRINAMAAKPFVKASPNPYIDKLNINFVSDVTGKGEVRLISASGNLVKITASSITKGYNNILLQDLQSQAPGLYIANIMINDKVVASVKVLKQ
jgi:hypothetical protein